MKKVVLPLLGAGLVHEAVFAQLRSRYEADVTDREIRNLIEWASAKNPQPCGWKPVGGGVRNFRPAPTLSERVTAQQAIANTEAWLGDFRCEECDLWHVSPWRPLEDWH